MNEWTHITGRWILFASYNCLVWYKWRQ